MYAHESQAHQHITPGRVGEGYLIFELKVTLIDTEPLIWRTIAVPSNYTLEQLGRVAARAMGWIPQFFNFFGCDGEFIRGSNSYMMDQKEEEELDDKQEGEPKKKKIKSKIARDIIISSILLDKKLNKQSITMDYGSDGWLHEIVMVKLRSPDKKYYPRCLDGKNACPPEDCGGSDGYKSMLAALSDRKHADHQNMKEWLDDSGYRKFNPKKFNVSSVVIGD